MGSSYDIGEFHALRVLGLRVKVQHPIALLMQVGPFQGMFGFAAGDLHWQAMIMSAILTFHLVGCSGLIALLMLGSPITGVKLKSAATSARPI